MEEIIWVLLNGLDICMLVSIKLLICFDKQMSYLWHFIKSLIVSVFQSTKEEQDSLFVRFPYNDKNISALFASNSTYSTNSLNKISLY